MNTQKHSCLTWSKEDFNGDEKLMNKFFTECDSVIKESINDIKRIWMLDNFSNSKKCSKKLVTIYYNDVFVSEEPFEIYENCPYVNIPEHEAEEYAENKIENREWDAYCIPEFITSHKVIFH